MSVSAGSTLGRYRLIREIGRGAVLFCELMTGKLVFQGDTPWSVVANILRGDIPDFRKILLGVDETVVDVIA